MTYAILNGVWIVLVGIVLVRHERRILELRQNSNKFREAALMQLEVVKSLVERADADESEHT